MEASALTHASRAGLLARRSPLLRLQGDERLVALIRAGYDRAFEVLFERYHARLLAFCRNMLRSTEDAEDVLQEVFANAHAAMLGDNRAINVRPWLYRIARNRCLNHLRKPVPEGQDTMDVHPHEGGTTTAERVQTREEFRALVCNVRDLPETQRTALLLREIEALCYEDIAAAMDTTVPAVKSLLVRARMSLAEATQSRLLTCGDVRLELAEAAEGLRKASGPVRYHVRSCEPCRDYRSELRSSGRALAALAPAGFVVLAQKLLGLKLAGSGIGASGVAGSSGAATGAGAAAAGGGAALGGAAAAAGGAAGGAIGTKAAIGVATAALLTAGAVEIKQIYSGQPAGGGATTAAAAQWLQGEGKAPLADARHDAKRERDTRAKAASKPAQAEDASSTAAVTAVAADAAAPDEEAAAAPAEGAAAPGETTATGSGGAAAGAEPQPQPTSGGGTFPIPLSIEPPAPSEPPASEPPAGEPPPGEPLLGLPIPLL